MLNMKRPEVWDGPAPDIERALMRQMCHTSSKKCPLYAETQEEQ